MRFHDVEGLSPILGFFLIHSGGEGLSCVQLRKTRLYLLGNLLCVIVVRFQGRAVPNMITCISGLPGGGKSLYAIWLMAQLDKRGKRVATNISITPKHPAYSRVFEIGSEKYPIVGNGKAFFSYFPRDKRGISGVNYFIDEADIELDSNAWKEMPDQLRLYFKQHRKVGDNVFLITQNPMWLYNRARDLVQEFIWCSRDSSVTPGATRLLMRLIPESMLRFRRMSFSHIDMKPSTFIREGYFTTKEAEQYFQWYRTEQLLGDMDF